MTSSSRNLTMRVEPSNGAMVLVARWAFSDACHGEGRKVRKQGRGRRKGEEEEEAGMGPGFLLIR
jgi:hypothetical protein